MHVHVYKEKNHAKIWLEPIVELAENKGFSEREINYIFKVVKKNEDNFKTKYRAHIG